MSLNGPKYYPICLVQKSPDGEGLLKPETFTDEQRTSEFALTGDLEILTPELGLSMNLSRELMSQIPGVTDEDLLLAEPEPDIEIYKEECLVQFGLDEASLEGLPNSEIIQRFYDTARLPVEYLNVHKREDLRANIELAIEKLTKLLIHRDNFVYESFHAVRLETAEGITDIETLHEVYRNIFHKFTQLSHKPDLTDEEESVGNDCAQALNEFAAVCQSFFEIKKPEAGYVEFVPTNFPQGTNYLVAKYAENFLYKIGISEDAHVDHDSFAPFRITKGRAAVFSDDKKRIYIADKPDSGRINFLTEKLLEEVKYEEQGQYFAKSIRPVIPEKLYELVFEVIDGGVALRSGGEFSVFDEADLVDYIALLRSDTRFVIEEEFNIHLSDLSIPEQFYFLKYLKSIRIEGSKQMQGFTQVYGVEGMRTFLALERGAEDLGDKITAFGRHEEVAKKIFSYYCELLAVAERAEQLVKEKSDCVGEVCVQLASQVRENILNRAQKDLEAAVRASDPGEIEAKIGNYVAEAKEYVAILQELGTQSTEKVCSSELTQSDREHMLALLRQNYDGAYQGVGEAEFRTTIRQSLEKSFNNPQTEYHLLRDGENIISFNRFDNNTNEEGKETSYFGSFNVDPTYSGVGGVMLERTIQEQLDKCDVMYAHCDPASEIAKKYIESGFVAKETETVAGKFSFEIWRTKDIAEHLKSKQMSVEELLEGDYQEENLLVREMTEGDAFEELDEGLPYLLTRYFKHNDKTYVVFEVPSPTLWNQLQT